MSEQTVGQFHIQWLDRGHDATGKSNALYPHGMDLYAALPDKPNCTAKLPYPQPAPVRRCGMFVLRCRICGLTATCTTAGRADDPRSMTVNCRPMARA